MVKVRMLTTSAGPDGSAQPGQIVLVSPVAADVLIAAGYAEAVAPEKTEPKPAPEAAALEAPPEKATQPAPKKRAARSKK